MRNDEVVDLLSSVELFRGLSKRHLKDLADRGRTITHTEGTLVTEEGGAAVGFHLLLDGTATVHLARNKSRQLGKGEYFGEISLVDGLPRSASVEAGPGLRTFALSAWEFRPLLEEEPHLALELLAGLCARLREAEASTPAG
jgi:CRP-like cAMP-binding protein